MEKLVRLPDECTVRMDEELCSSNDFVAVLTGENGDASLYYQTDALTLGMSLRLIAKAFVECMNNCTQEERDAITAILGDSLIEEVPSEEH